MIREYFLPFVLLLFMAVTRYHHFGSALHLPDASWAIFFAAGFYLSRLRWLAVFLAGAGLIDYLAITQGGSNGYCISAAYPFLIPAYGSLWLGGRWLQRYQGFAPATLMYLAMSALVAVTLCFVISNGAFYLFSGRFGELSFAEYGVRFFKYYPMFLKTTLGYLAIFALLHVLAHKMKGSPRMVKS